MKAIFKKLLRQYECKLLRGDHDWDLASTGYATFPVPFLIRNYRCMACFAVKTEDSRRSS